MRLTPFALFAILMLAGCSGPREPMMDPRAARADRRVMRVKILETYNNSRMEYTTEQRVGWVVDVEVLQGPSYLIGKSLTLPYDDFALGAPPPDKDTEVVMTPADWVTQPGSVKYRMRER